MQICIYSVNIPIVVILYFGVAEYTCITDYIGNFYPSYFMTNTTTTVNTIYKKSGRFALVQEM